MKKAINDGYGGLDQIEIIETELPKVSSGEVLVKVRAAGLNPKDVLVRKGKFKRFTGSKFPQGIGFEFSGVIEDPKNSDFQKGESVFGMVNGWNGRCVAEYVNVKEKELYKMPAQLSFEAAAGIPLAGQTALQAIRDLGHLRNGDKIMINGASGGVGTLAIQIAKALGGEVATVSSTKNLPFCKSLGADQTISYQETKLLELSATFDVFFDVFGNYSFRKVEGLLKTNGIYITTVPKADIIKEQFFNLFRKKKAKLVVVRSNEKDLKWFYEKIEVNQVQPVIDQVFNLSTIQAAQKHIESKRAKGKVIVMMSN
ncbi:MAG: NAD(P)-dependent alcohol dehydrogenase [Saprospiraceae bacterium]|nr:NAD(P)-dependent alcohol dehydrogenase [Saprospiraceae bacterium]